MKLKQLQHKAPTAKERQVIKAAESAVKRTRAVTALPVVEVKIKKTAPVKSKKVPVNSKRAALAQAKKMAKAQRQQEEEAKQEIADLEKRLRVPRNLATTDQRLAKIKELLLEREKTQDTLSALSSGEAKRILDAKIKEIENMGKYDDDDEDESFPNRDRII
jgi:hypothetical protein